MDRSLVKTSKFLSLVLRHRPETIGVELSPTGWVDVEELLTAAAKHNVAIDRPLLNRVVEQNDKKRFAFNDDGTMIRASQGHSVEIDLELTPVEPPDTLYHGTVAKFLESIAAQGLTQQKRQHVHLSADTKTATLVGQRRGKPVILTIRAGEMHAAGRKFFLSANGVWLTDHVPPQYIEFP